MQIKTFEAPNMTAALQRIRKAFGPDAVILSARTVKKRSGLFGTHRAKGVEVTAAMDPSPGERGSATNAPASLPAMARVADRYAAMSPQARSGPNQTSGRSGGPGVNNHDSDPRRAQPKAADSRPKAAASLFQRLTGAGVAPEIAHELAEQAEPPSLGVMSLRRQNRSLARQLLRFRMVDDRKSPLERRQCTVVVGPPGAGKTTTLAKMAAAALGGKKRIGLISLDQVRIGALDQIRRFAQLLDIPLEPVMDTADLRRIITRWAQMDHIFIDTPGIGARQIESLERINHLLAQIQPVTVQLVVSATDRDDVCRQTLDRFSCLKPDGLVVTRMDECPKTGCLIHASFWSRIPLAYFSEGPDIPEHLRPATTDAVIGRIVSDPEEGHYRRGSDDRPEAVPDEAAARPVGRHPTEFSASYVANNNSDIFHRPECKWTTMIKNENALGFASVSEARARGFKPCRYCSPDKVEAVFAPPSNGKKKVHAVGQR
jgi:flagellar biosynthesis protein FlhF